MKPFSLFTVTLLLISSFFILSPTVEAQLVCPQGGIEQITDFDMDSSSPSISSDGLFIAFESNANINGGNPDGNEEIYLFDTTTGIFTQITDTTTGRSDNASINADGTHIAFDSNAAVIGPNPGDNEEIYLFDTTTGIITQITDEPSGNSTQPSINADGRRIAFRSDADINGPNIGGNLEIYLFDTTTGIFTQITDEPSGVSESPSVNADGTRIAFSSDANINGPNPGDNQEIYLFDTTTGIITQITSEPSGNSDDSSINADGTRVAFESRANINGGNPDGNLDVYYFDTTTGIITQITSDPSANSENVSISGDGIRIGFESNADINGTNPDGNREIYIFDTVTGLFTQVTDNSNFNNEPSLNADGTRIAIESEFFPNGSFDGINQILLARCLDPSVGRPIPTMSEWGLIVMAGVLGVVAFLALRRRAVAC